MTVSETSFNLADAEIIYGVEGVGAIMTELTDVDRAVELLVADAEAHEGSGDGSFCEDHRVSLVVFVMLHLGLDLYSLGLVAAGLAEMTTQLDDDEEGDDDDVLQSPEISVP